MLILYLQTSTLTPEGERIDRQLSIQRREKVRTIKAYQAKIQQNAWKECGTSHSRVLVQERPGKDNIAVNISRACRRSCQPPKSQDRSMSNLQDTLHAQVVSRMHHRQARSCTLVIFRKMVTRLKILQHSTQVYAAPGNIFSTSKEHQFT